MEKLKKAIVVHSGGMDSSLCLALALKKYKPEEILSLGFDYQQRHSSELEAAQKICKDWKVDRFIIPITFMNQITQNALINHKEQIGFENEVPNTLVSGRNGLMARIAGIHADSLGANEIYLGVMELEEANSGYRDCNRDYFDLIEKALQIDFANTNFTIQTPLVQMTKLDSMKLAENLGVLDYLLEETVTCYEGIKGRGCEKCPACLLRNEGIDQFRKL